MSEHKIVIKYYNIKMLMTLDCNMLLRTIIEIYGNNICIQYLHMSQAEQNSASSIIDGMTAVNTRFEVYESVGDSKYQRRIDLEERIVNQGIK